MAVTASWTEGARTRDTQTGIINNPGSASGPAAVDHPARLHLALPGDDGCQHRHHDVSTSSKPTTMAWMLDGSRQSSAVHAPNGSTGLLWQFDWNVKTLDDGIYVVAAEAYDVYGVSGPSRQETVVLNRFPPKPPKQVAGGRTKFGTVEIEWTANSERDIIGYQVFRVGAASPVCDIASQKLSTSASTPRRPATTRSSTTCALRPRPAGQRRESADSTHLIVTKDNTAPYPIQGLSAGKLPSGDTQLTLDAAVARGSGRGRLRPVLPDLPRRHPHGQPVRALLRLERQPDGRLERHDTNGVALAYYVTAVDTALRRVHFTLPVIE